MDLLLAGYGSSDDEDETQKEDVQAAAEASITKDETSKGKGKRTVSLMLPISKEALRGKYEDEFMHQSGPALPEAPKPSGLSALLPAPKNPTPAKRQRMATPAAVVRRQMENAEDKSDSSTSTPSSDKGEAAKPAASTTTGNEGQGAPRQPPLEYAAAGTYDAAAYGAYPGYEAYYQYGYQQQGYAQAGWDYSQQQQAQPQASLGDLPEPPPEVCSIFTTLLDHLAFTREWEHLTKGAKIVDVSQAQITDKTGWSKEFIQENLAKATSSVSAKDRPMGMQKRKHQITSLAYEAKQREMELLNQRANARKTKSETWGKYGW
ncbi:uncharacterized protein ACA1_245670 [Acanthamoeba castellanii str. Neff]|uniref:Mitotic checkpoint regulator, MAD2B-interacting-domain-containing protein n=1 Tax=Acanthamoeba castellanii (strain ATCC 30010 / Neff) TaxID=1257118 RepID=L8GKU8_ACACF|nr:uncharacterized protein ACA1_245670 [Acanthamoeba castellanii str. Neff]ELR13464.1 hypothetical protein ACA1_245670 [Acanthamoeba castellanii str. Neff]